MLYHIIRIDIQRLHFVQRARRDRPTGFVRADIERLEARAPLSGTIGDEDHVEVGPLRLALCQQAFCPSTLLERQVARQVRPVLHLDHEGPVHARRIATAQILLQRQEIRDEIVVLPELEHPPQVALPPEPRHPVEGSPEHGFDERLGDPPFDGTEIGALATACHGEGDRLRRWWGWRGRAPAGPPPRPRRGWLGGAGVPRKTGTGAPSPGDTGTTP